MKLRFFRMQAGLYLTMMLLPLAAMAIGMENLKPDEKTGTVDSETAAPADADAKATATGTAMTKSEAPMVPSEMSKALADRLNLTTSLGFISLSASQGEWQSGRGVVDVGLAYRWATKIFGTVTPSSTFRYVPVDATVVADGISYRAIVEGYHIGGLYRLPLKDSMSVFGTSELGLMKVHVRNMDQFETDTALAKTGVNITLGGGVDWQLEPKLAAGAKLDLGVGRFRTAQLAGTMAFIF